MTELYKFDEGRAAQGEPVQFCKTGGEWVDVHYVGVDRVRGGFFVQFYDGLIISTYVLRMKPLPTKKWVMEFDTEQHAKDAVQELRHVGWGDSDVPAIKEVEVPPEVAP